MLSNEVILLSSDEENDNPPKKRVKLVTIPSTSTAGKVKDEEPSSSNTPQCIVLSDDDQESENEPSSPISNDTSVVVNATVNSSIVENGTVDHDHGHITKLYKDFLNKCIENIKDHEHRKVVDEKLQYMYDAFDKYLHFTDDYTSFQKNLEVNFEKVTNQPKRALICFTDIYQLVKFSLRDVTEAAKVPEGKRSVMKKLERTLAKLKRRIDELDESDCDFNAEQNSTYLQAAKYKQRAAEVYAKLCKYRKLNQFSGRISHQRLKFQHATHPEINEAINKKYKNNTVFPEYHEMEKLIRKCVRDNPSIGSMTDLDIKIESRRCFEKLGNYIQCQRKLDLYSLHSDYLVDVDDDPAKDNPGLQGELLRSYQTKVEQENQIFEKFSALQEKGVKCDESEEGSVADSESDNDENNGNDANEQSNNIDCITIDD